MVQNILKYSMAHSRVYIAMNDQDGKVTVSLKNMSATEMNFTPEEITERFVRGDLSRKRSSMLYCIRIKEDPAVSRAEMIHLCPIFAGKKVYRRDSTLCWKKCLNCVKTTRQ